MPVALLQYIQYSVLIRRVLLCSSTMMWGLMFAYSGLHAQPDPVAPVVESFKGNVAAIRANFEHESEQRGFGFVTGEANGKLYLATAAHVVREQGLKTDSIRLRFFGDPRWFKAKLLRAWETEDLALLETDKPLSYKWKKDGIDLSPTVYQKVRFIGQNSDPPSWVSPGSGDIHDISGGHIRFGIGTILPGCSGAPLLTEKGIAGLIFQDDAGISTAIRIARVRELFLAGGQTHFFALEPSNIVPTAAPAIEVPAAPPSANQIFLKNDLVFELEECRVNGRYIECALTIKNNGRSDIALYMYGQRGSSITAANNGYEYYANNVRLAELTNSNQVQKSIIARTSIKAAISFDLITDTVKRLSKITIRCYADGAGYFDVDFRDVSVK